jgi:hypothetical protein
VPLGIIDEPVRVGDHIAYFWQTEQESERGCEFLSAAGVARIDDRPQSSCASPACRPCTCRCQAASGRSLRSPAPRHRVSSSRRRGSTTPRRRAPRAVRLASMCLVVRAFAELSGGTHDFPRSPKFSVRSGEIDPSWPIIQLLTRLKLARSNRTIQETGQSRLTFTPAACPILISPCNVATLLSSTRGRTGGSGSRPMATWIAAYGHWARGRGSLSLRRSRRSKLAPSVERRLSGRLPAR